MSDNIHRQAELVKTNYNTDQSSISTGGGIPWDKIRQLCPAAHMAWEADEPIDKVLPNLKSYTPSRLEPDILGLLNMWSEQTECEAPTSQTVGVIKEYLHAIENWRDTDCMSPDDNSWFHSEETEAEKVVKQDWREAKIFDAMCKTFNQHHGFVAIGSKGRFVTFEDGDGMTFHGVDAFYSLHSHIAIPNVKATTGDPVSFVPRWLNSTKAQPAKFDRLTFSPNKTQKAVYPHLNVWRGLGVKPKAGDWSLMQRHIREVLTNGSEKDYQWVIGWMAWILQNFGDPKKKLTISPVVKGVEGAGKSIVFDYFAKIFGRHGIALSKPEHVVGKFNAPLAEALVVLLEEAFFAGDPTIRGPLNELLTGKDMMLEKKGIDPIKVPNYAHFVVISNSDRPVPIDGGARRYYAIECSPDKANNREWFDPIFAQMDNGGLEAMAWDLLHYTPPGGDWSFLREFPHTEAGNAMIAGSLAPLERFLLEWWHAGRIEKGVFGGVTLDLDLDHESLIDTADIVKGFRQWLETNISNKRELDKVKSGAVTIGLKVKAMLPTLKREASRHGGRGKVYPTQEELIRLVRMHPNQGYRTYLDWLDQAS